MKFEPSTTPEQWHCIAGGGHAGQADVEYGFHNHSAGVVRSMADQIANVLSEPDGDAGSLYACDLAPDWRGQQCRVVVNCVGTTQWEWRRIGLVVTLGELFLLLGQDWTAAAIYSLYRALRIVALKRRKTSSASAPASGSATGMTGSDLQAGKIRRLSERSNTSWWRSTSPP